MEKINSHRIEELLERYFEGETSAAEERQIRVFFSAGEVPEHLAVYISLFAYFDEEIECKVAVQQDKTNLKFGHTSVRTRYSNRVRRAFYIFSGVAACMLALLSLTRWLDAADPCLCSGNYVVINGRCYTDIQTVRLLAIEALHEVATPAEAYFPQIDADEVDRKFIDDQLRELGSFFGEDE